jgi:hypothetical protein
LLHPYKVLYQSAQGTRFAARFLVISAKVSNFSC